MKPTATLPCLGALVFALFVTLGCDGSSDSVVSSDTETLNPEQEQAGLLFNLAQIELALADRELPYLVIDLPARRLDLRLKGATVWDSPLEFIGADSQQIARFALRFLGNHECLERNLYESYLYSFSDQVPESVLAIISDATKFDATLMQREIPERFFLRWEGPVIFEIITGVEGRPRSGLKNTLFDVEHALSRPLGAVTLSIRMRPECAVTLYRVAQPGLPTILIPLR